MNRRAARTWPADSRVGAGVGVAVAVVGLIAQASGGRIPIPVAATAVVVFSVPRTTTARLTVMLPAHAGCGLIGFAVLGAVGGGPIAVAASASLAVFAMRRLRHWHIPAALTAVAATATEQNLTWLLTLVLPGTAAVWATAVIAHRSIDPTPNDAEDVGPPVRHECEQS